MGVGLGKKQRETLALMARHDGVWPPEWIISRTLQKIIDSLVLRGLIEPTTVRRGTCEVGTYRLAGCEWRRTPRG